ncbi:hypothetical protein [Sphingobacterium sp. E70]|uniref:hypothetical protein n=1 Tax=Sphingobacterium sp. E70 TaxID=2853439 RepID=UPI00359C87B2
MALCIEQKPLPDVFKVAKNKSQISLDEFVKYPEDLHQYEQQDEKEEQLTAMEGCLEKLPDKQQQSVRLFSWRKNVTKRSATRQDIA